MAFPKNVCIFMYKTDISVKHKEWWKCIDAKCLATEKKQTKKLQKFQRIEKRFVKIFDILINLEGLVCEERAFYALML